MSFTRCDCPPLRAAYGETGSLGHLTVTFREPGCRSVRYDPPPKMADVIKVFLADPAKARYGYELMRLTGRSSNSMYTALAKLEKAGWLTAGKEDIDPHAAGRPPRRVYRISGAAVSVARTQLAALSERYRPPKPVRPRLMPRRGML